MGKLIIQNNLWMYRKRNGLSQKKVVFFLGHKTPSQLSNYERGTKTPSLANALKLEIIYGVPVSFLYKEVYEKIKKGIEKSRLIRKCIVEEE